jgi:hypothetical protein
MREIRLVQVIAHPASPDSLGRFVVGSGANMQCEWPSSRFCHATAETLISAPSGEYRSRRGVRPSFFQYYLIPGDFRGWLYY